MENSMQQFNVFLVGAVSALSVAITSLALYIRKVHIKHEEKRDKDLESMVEMTKEFTKATSEMTNAVENNTSSADKVNTTVSDLHKYIIQNMK